MVELCTCAFPHRAFRCRPMRWLIRALGAPGQYSQQPYKRLGGQPVCLSLYSRQHPFALVLLCFALYTLQHPTLHLPHIHALLTSLITDLHTSSSCKYDLNQLLINYCYSLKPTTSCLLNLSWPKSQVVTNWGLVPFVKSWNSGWP